MARANIDQMYNGSAAYDLQHFGGTAAPQIDHQGLPEDRPLPYQHRHVKVKTAIAPISVLGLMVTACMLILVVFGYVQLYEATERVSDLKSQLSDLRQEQVVLESLYEGGIDLDAVEAQAATMGFAVPEREQVVYLNLTGSDKAEIYTVEKENIFQRVIHAIEISAGGLVEYLS
ncbi:MAG: hypothetical protein J6J43_01430 [Oscillospiraceae bacterium]|nr:hypothetical protein [Oscillospiraceae bacterium]